ncbi:MAG: hypothetical protein HXL07_03390 [Candidatus Nanosynbacter sp.]|nr:hypothetical protein [Candidatus Nanosynbacter sp.]
MSEPLSKQELHHLLGVSVTDSHITRAVYINELKEVPNEIDVLHRHIDIYKKAKEYHKTTLEYAKKAGFVDESLASSILEDKSWMPDDVNIIQDWYNNCTEEDRIDKMLVSAHSHILHALSQLTYATDIVNEVPDNLREDHRDIEDCYAQFERYLRKSVFATTLAVNWIFAGSSNSTYVVAGLEQTLEYKLSYDPATVVDLYLGLAPKRKSDKSN